MYSIKLMARLSGDAAQYARLLVPLLLPGVLCQFLDMSIDLTRVQPAVYVV